MLHRYPWKLHWAQLLGIDLGGGTADQKESTHKGLGSPPLDPRIGVNTEKPLLPPALEPGREVGGGEGISDGQDEVEGFLRQNKPVLPLAVCRSTSTVGLPLESRISRAKIFCMAMAAPQEM